MWYEFREFSRYIETIESFLYEVAEHEDDLAYMGLKSTLKKLNSRAPNEAFYEFSTKLATCLRKAPFVNRILSGQLTALLEETKIESSITEFAVCLKLSEPKKPIKKNPTSYINILIESIYTLKKQKQNLSNESMKLEPILASLSRLRVLINLLSDESYHIKDDTDEIFKPRNINAVFVAEQIDLAVEDLQRSANLPWAEKEQLISYLREAKAELASNSPAWKKIVGALVIGATLLSGMADAPQALGNLNAAIKHILGTSVQRTLPNLQPGRALENEPNKHPYIGAIG